MNTEDLVQQAALRIFVAKGRHTHPDLVRLDAERAWKVARQFADAQPSRSISTSVAEQLDKLVGVHQSLTRWNVTSSAHGYECLIFTSLLFQNNAYGSAPTFAEAAEQATVKAMAMIHEGRSE